MNNGQLGTIKQIDNQDWYLSLVEECKAIIVETEFTSRWSLVEGYHTLGQRISEEKSNFDRAGLYGQKITARVAESIGKSTRTVERAVQFYQKFPDLAVLPEGKDTSWHQVVNRYLPETTEAKVPTVSLNLGETELSWLTRIVEAHNEGELVGLQILNKLTQKLSKLKGD